MAAVLLFHHALGVTPGVRDFADRIRLAGHTVDIPDFYDGRVFDNLEAGVAHAERIGFETILERGRATAEQLPTDLVYAGISLGVLPAQMLAQTRAGAKGALLFEACVPASEFGTWPSDLPVQIHGMEGDEFFAGEGDLEAARALVESTSGAELFTYAGNRHLFVDASFPSYDAEAAESCVRRVLSFLQGIF
ncbi:MAG: dienelactone hydrolase family protein [Planctomycetes bacterium]|nr:dienelactone hydrolase family protein [Planctomycetota bacterium]MCA8947146.1 dienelactone hydrolase family protein [Planctomycetota bacterium]